MASHLPTRGQQHVLHLLCRAAYVLWATPSDSLALTYILTERTTGRQIQTLTPKMVTSLVDAGWIECELGQPQATYRVTQAGGSGGEPSTLAVSRKQTSGVAWRRVA